MKLMGPEDSLSMALTLSWTLVLPVASMGRGKVFTGATLSSSTRSVLDSGR